jgi:hypothetical protein
MATFSWNSTLLSGLVLVGLGLGNWLVSRDKVAEYSHRAAAGNSIRTGTLAEFENLTPRTNAALIERLHRGPNDYNLADAKLDFYRVVESGGSIFTVTGLLMIAVALVRHRSQRRPTSGVSG